MLRDAFKTPALVGYLVGGHPTPDECVAHASALIEGGVRVLELGVPFSDPIADGPTIQEASAAALEAGITPPDVLEVASRVHDEHPDVPLVLMTYANIPYKYGPARFAKDALAAGVRGIILPDVPLESTARFEDLARGLDVVQLASPASDDARLQRIAAASQGFLYLVGLYGVTGARDRLSPETKATTRRVAPFARAAGIPLCVGFGVSTAAHARELVASGADGVVVGSAFVRRVLDGRPPADLQKAAAGIAAGLA